MSNGVGTGLKWKLLERFGVLGVQFVLQIILARLLAPEHYGVLSIMMIFVMIANVFIQSGFNTSLIQNKDVSEDDYSSVFWVSLVIALLIYIIIFFTTPWIAMFYKMPELITPLRVLALVVFPGALNSVQLAKASREMDFRKVFLGSVIGAIASGVIGIVVALLNGGLWALVVQTLLNTSITCVVMRLFVRLKIRMLCDWKRIRILFSYGWKLLLSNLLNVVYTDLHSLVIGKKYDSGILGYFNRGKQFPQYIINAIDSAIQSVMLPALSREQEKSEKVKVLMRNSLRMSAYIVFPIMFGLAAVASNLIELLLTEKWLPCVPYMQIYCFSMAFYPIHSCNLQAINAMGRSDIFLKLEVVKKLYGIGFLVVALVCFDSPIYIAWTTIITTIISSFVNAAPNKKLIGYSYFEQIKDIVPYLLMSVVMYFLASICGSYINIAIVSLLFQILVGVFSYLFLSFIFRVEPFWVIIDFLKHKNKKIG
jgi:O-antigen/teichoic acid export membrane protein